MTDPRTIEIPDGYKAIIVSDELLNRFRDWTTPPPDAQFRVAPCEPFAPARVAEIETRRLAASLTTLDRFLRTPPV